MTVLVGVLDVPVPGDGREGLPQPGEICGVVPRAVSTTNPGVRKSVDWDGWSSGVSMVGYWLIRSLM